MSNFNNFSNQLHRYILEKGSKKHYCPNCEKKRFVRYVDTETREYLPEHYGRCDREVKCPQQDYNNPYRDGYVKSIQNQDRANNLKLSYKWRRQQKKATPKPMPETACFDYETFKKTLEPQRYEQNIFIQNLLRRVEFPFEVQDIEKVISLYNLGTITNGYREGAITFPFMDVEGNVRAIQVKQFDEQNHTTGTDFLHSMIEKYHNRINKPLPEWLKAYNENETKVSCLFGEHLLREYPNNPVALVEAPKTAIYGTLYFGFPDTIQSFIWLAVYNKSSFTFEKLKALKGRFVSIFPDLSNNGETFKEWETKAREYENRLPKTCFQFSDLLEKYASKNERMKGYDLADYLIKQNWKYFRNSNQEKSHSKIEKVTEVTEVTPPQNIISSHVEPLKKVEVFKPEPIVKEQPQSWEQEITDLENYFSSIELPTHPIMLNQCSKIRDCSEFIESHFATVKANNGKRTFLPYLNRLQELKQVLSNN